MVVALVNEVGVEEAAGDGDMCRYKFIWSLYYREDVSTT
jgi:hypothetical protein